METKVQNWACKKSFDCITKSNKSDKHVFCTVCSVNISVADGSRQDITTPPYSCLIIYANLPNFTVVRLASVHLHLHTGHNAVSTSEQMKQRTWIVLPTLQTADWNVGPSWGCGNKWERSCWWPVCSKPSAITLNTVSINTQLKTIKLALMTS